MMQEDEFMEIKVLGPGCPKCKQTEEIVKQAVAEEGIAANIEKVTDIMKIAGYGVFGTPAVIIDGEVKSVGKIPKKGRYKNMDKKMTRLSGRISIKKNICISVLTLALALFIFSTTAFAEKMIIFLLKAP